MSLELLLTAENLVFKLFESTDKFERSVLAGAALHIFNSIPESYETMILDQVRATDFYFVRGFVHFELEQYQAAVDDLKKAGQLDPTDSCIHFNIGYSKINLGQIEEGLKELDRAFELGANNDERLLYQAGVIHEELKRYPEAIKYFERAIELKPSFNAYTSLGFIYIVLEHFEEARRNYNLALELSPTALAYNHRGISNFELERFAEALDDFNRCKELAGSDMVQKVDDLSEAIIFLNLGAAKAGLQQWKEALKDLDRAILDEQPAYAYSWRGLVHEKLDEKDKATHDYLTAFFLLRNIPKEKLTRSDIKRSIKTTEGLIRLGFDHSKDLRSYQILALERGYHFSQ